MPSPLLIAAAYLVWLLLVCLWWKRMKGPRDLPFASSDLDRYEAARRNPKGP